MYTRRYTNLPRLSDWWLYSSCMVHLMTTCGCRLSTATWAYWNLQRQTCLFSRPTWEYYGTTDTTHGCSQRWDISLCAQVCHLTLWHLTFKTCRPMAPFHTMRLGNACLALYRNNDSLYALEQSNTGLIHFLLPSSKFLDPKKPLSHCVVNSFQISCCWMQVRLHDFVWLFMPVNIAGIHWALLAAHVPSSTVSLVDSLSMSSGARF